MKGDEGGTVRLALGSDVSLLRSVERVTRGLELSPFCLPRMWMTPFLATMSGRLIGLVLASTNRPTDERNGRKVS